MVQGGRYPRVAAPSSVARYHPRVARMVPFPMLPTESSAERRLYEGFLEQLDEYKVSSALVRQDSVHAAKLDRSPTWRRRYAAGVAAVYQRVRPGE